MKRQAFNWVTILMVVFMSIGIISCNDNEDDKGVSIVGTWVNGTTTIKFGSDGSYNLTNTSVPSIPQYRKGSYSYNPEQKLLAINVIAIEGNNGAYQDVYIVQTLTETTLVLLYPDGDVEGYYTRK